MKDWLLKQLKQIINLNRKRIQGKIHQLRNLILLMNCHVIKDGCQQVKKTILVEQMLLKPVNCLYQRNKLKNLNLNGCKLFLKLIKILLKSNNLLDIWIKTVPKNYTRKTLGPI